MSAEILRHDTYDTTSFLNTHTLSNFDNSGTDTINVTFGFNRNPAADVDRWEIDSEEMTIEEESINANVVSIQGVWHAINDDDVDVVCFTPDFRQQTFITMAVGGVDQSTPIADSFGGGGFGVTATTSYTGTEGNLLIVAVGTQNDRTFTPSGVTEVEQLNSDGGIGGCFVGYVEATGSAQTVGATFSGNDNWRIIVMEVTAGVATTIGGKVTIGAQDVEGATVRIIRQGGAGGVGVVQARVFTDENGEYSVAVPEGNVYHTVVEFEDTEGDYGSAGQKYNAESLWDVEPHSDE